MMQFSTPRDNIHVDTPKCEEAHIIVEELQVPMHGLQHATNLDGYLTMDEASEICTFSALVARVVAILCSILGLVFGILMLIPAKPFDESHITLGVCMILLTGLVSFCGCWCITSITCCFTTICSGCVEDVCCKHK